MSLSSQVRFDHPEGPDSKQASQISSEGFTALTSLLGIRLDFIKTA
jgi:hypothetical protein